MTTAYVSPDLPKRARRPPKEMVPLKPEEFAAQLISRLESLKRKQDTISCLEERLQQIKEVCTPFFFSSDSHNIYFKVLG